MRFTLIVLTSIVFSLQAEPRRMETRHATTDWVIAEKRLFPSENRESSRDEEIQSALDTIGKQGGGTLFLSPGEYRISRPIRIPQGVTLRGDYNKNLPTQSTILSIVANENMPDAAAAFTLGRGAGLIGLVFWYPRQNLKAPIPYPWTIRTQSISENDNQTISDCTLVNAWQGIRIGPESNELHTFRRVQICALKTGFSIDSTTDIGRISEVLIAPSVWAQSGFPQSPQKNILRDFLHQNGTLGADYGRSDWEFIWRLHIDGYQTGIQFRKGKRGLSNAVMADSRITDAETALKLVELNGVGLSIYNSLIEGNKESVSLSPSFHSIVQFHSCQFPETAAPIFHHAPGIASFSHCSHPVIDARTSSGHLVLHNTQPQKIFAGSKMKRLHIRDFDPQKTEIVNQTQHADVQIEPGQPTNPEKRIAPEPMVFPKPASPRIFSVKAFQASPNREDNTPAFQAALNAAAKEGGTVYIPAGYYSFSGNLTVPSGVELRGASDVPHHTISGGSVLLIHHGENQENGTPFLQLEKGSGLRGLCCWYPRQPVSAPRPYPWTVRSLGSDCWLTDVTIGNAWQAVDFETYPSDGHRISYLAGAMFRRGLFIGNNKSRGWVEDVQFNPHYALRLPRIPVPLPRTFGPAKDPGDAIIQYQRQHLEGIRFKNCTDEQVRGTFLYAAKDGLALLGTCDMELLIHGTDTGSRGISLRTSKTSNVRIALAQLVPLGKWAEAAIYAHADDAGDTTFLNTQFWVNFPTLLQEGQGIIRMDQFNSLSGPIIAKSGKVEIRNGVFDLDLPAHAIVSNNATASLIGCINRKGTFRITRQQKDMKQTP